MLTLAVLGARGRTTNTHTETSNKKKRAGSDEDGFSFERDRFRAKLCHTLLLRKPAAALLCLIRSQECAYYAPELCALAQAQHPCFPHKDHLLHSIEVTRKTPPRLRLRLAALFHDTGKPATRTYSEKGVLFHLHETVGADLTRHRLQELGFPQTLTEDVTRLVAMHTRANSYSSQWRDAAVRRLAKDAGHTLADLLLLARADTTARDPGLARSIATRMDQLETRLGASPHTTPHRPVLNGHEVMQCLQLGPGPLVGEAMRFLLAHDAELQQLEKKEVQKKLIAWHRSQNS